jgi:hypothetical protein
MIEYEIGDGIEIVDGEVVQGKRTGRWRRRQFYAPPPPLQGQPTTEDRRPPSERKACEWRNPPAPAKGK